jgi:hypothetical protein
VGEGEAQGVEVVDREDVAVEESLRPELLETAEEGEAREERVVAAVAELLPVLVAPSMREVEGLVLGVMLGLGEAEDPPEALAVALWLSRTVPLLQTDGEGDTVRESTPLEVKKTDTDAEDEVVPLREGVLSAVGEADKDGEGEDEPVIVRLPVEVRVTLIEEEMLGELDKDNKALTVALTVGDTLGLVEIVFVKLTVKVVLTVALVEVFRENVEAAEVVGKGALAEPVGEAVTETLGLAEAQTDGVGVVLGVELVHSEALEVGHTETVEEVVGEEEGREEIEDSADAVATTVGVGVFELVWQVVGEREAVGQEVELRLTVTVPVLQEEAVDTFTREGEGIAELEIEGVVDAVLSQEGVLLEESEGEGVTRAENVSLAEREGETEGDRDCE